MSMLSGIFSLRNFVKKQLIKTNDQGIMTLPDKGQIDFGEMMIRENLFKRGIDVRSVTSEKQLEGILNTPIPTPPPPKSADVLDLTGKKIDTDKPIVGGKNIDWEAVEKTDIEDFAQGGRTGLSYLLAEDTNERMPFKMGRRAFLKLMGGVGAGIGALKTGALKLFGKEGATVAKEVTQVPIGNPPGMPSWFKPLVNKVIKEGEEVSGDLERVITHKTTLPGSKTDVYVTQDLNTGDVIADIGMGKHGFPDGKFGQPVRLEYKASEEIPLGGASKGKGSVRTTDEFNVEEAEFTGGHPENVKFEETTVEKFGDHASDFTEVEKFATGKVKDTNPTKKRLQTEFESGKAEADAERWTEEAMDDVDMAYGGRAGYVFGGKVAAGILSLLKNPKKLREAYDNIFPTGDYKYDAEMVAESLVENNPKVFGNRLYEDLTDRERMAVYAAGLDEASTNFAKQLKMKRAMDKASRPTKTLEGIEKTGTIDISDDAVAEEFTNFMKETDPVGYSKIQKVVDDANQQLELKRFKTKGRKKNALGGLANMLGE